MNKDIEYEIAKRKMQKKDLTPEEYERAIWALCKRLNY